MRACWWGGGAVSSGFEKIRGGVISRETALKNVKGETLRLIKLYAAIRWNPPKSIFLKVKQQLRMNTNYLSPLLTPFLDHLEGFLMKGFHFAGEEKTVRSTQQTDLHCEVP